MKKVDDTMARGHQGKDRREWHEGAAAGRQCGDKGGGKDGHRYGSIVSFAAVIGQKSADEYNRLKSDAARQGFFDGVIEGTSRAEHDWARFYAVVQLMRSEEWYWRGEGYETFEAFWHDKVGGTYAKLDDLETVYNFAKMARPELFDIKDFDQVRAELREVDLEIGRLYRVPMAPSHGGARGNRYTATKKEATARVADAAAFKAPGECSIERRFAKLRRDNPDVAAELLAGKYIRQLENGKWHVDMNWAERVAYGEDNAARQRRRREEKQKKSDVEKLQVMLKTGNAKRRQTITEAVRGCPWLMDALKSTETTL